MIFIEGHGHIRAKGMISITRIRRPISKGSLWEEHLSKFSMFQTKIKKSPNVGKIVFAQKRGGSIDGSPAYGHQS
jgi:hypothetical protein